MEKVGNTEKELYKPGFFKDMAWIRALISLFYMIGFSWLLFIESNKILLGILLLIMSTLFLLDSFPKQSITIYTDRIELIEKMPIITRKKTTIYYSDVENASIYLIKNRFLQRFKKIPLITLETKEGKIYLTPSNKCGIALLKQLKVNEIPTTYT